MRFKLFILAILISLTNCTKDKWNVTITTKDGVTYVHNPYEGIWDREDSRKKLRLILELSIGTLEGDENELLHRIGFVIADDDGNIYM